MQPTGDALATALIQSRFDAWVAAWPGHATRFGLHQYDGRLPDLTRAAKEADIAAERAFVRQLEALAINHQYEEFNDTHSGISYRLDRSLPLLYRAITGH